MKLKTKKPSAPRAQRWVVKVGSNSICSGGILLLKAWMQQLSHLRKKHQIEIVWVTSGAIASAIERTGFKKHSRRLPEKQALSAIGQPLLMDLYNLALQAHGLLGAQILLTYSDLKDPIRLGNFQRTLEELLKWGVTPILNENDAIATEEIKFGDNDALSAQVARCVKADRLIILTDVEGLYDTDPKKNRKAQLISTLSKVPPSLLKSLSSHAGSNKGTGGMFSKLRAAKNASENGIPTWLVKGDLPHVLIRVAENQSVGTRVEGKML